MKLCVMLAAAALALPLSAANAQSVADTHEQVWMPAGKTVQLFRPVKRDLCRDIVLHRPAGKIATHAVAKNSNCATTAAADSRTALAAR